MFSFSFSVPRPITCFLSITKNCAQFQFLNPKAHYMFLQYDKKSHFATLSFSFSIPRPITCFHSMIKKRHFTVFSFSFSIPRPNPCFHRMTKNLTSLHSVSLFQSQGPLHISNGIQTLQFIPTFPAQTTHQIYVGEYFSRACRSLLV